MRLEFTFSIVVFLNNNIDFPSTQLNIKINFWCFILPPTHLLCNIVLFNKNYVNAHDDAYARHKNPT